MCMKICQISTMEMCVSAEILTTWNDVYICMKQLALYEVIYQYPLHVCISCHTCGAIEETPAINIVYLGQAPGCKVLASFIPTSDSIDERIVNGQTKLISHSTSQFNMHFSTFQHK